MGSDCLQAFGLSQLRDGASSQSLRSIICALTLLFYHTYVSLILGEKNFSCRSVLTELLNHLVLCWIRNRRGEPGGGRSPAGAVQAQVPQSELGPAEPTVLLNFGNKSFCFFFLQGSIVLFYTARIATLQGNFQKVFKKPRQHSAVVPSLTLH